MHHACMHVNNKVRKHQGIPTHPLGRSIDFKSACPLYIAACPHYLFIAFLFLLLLDFLTGTADSTSICPPQEIHMPWMDGWLFLCLQKYPVVQPVLSEWHCLLWNPGWTRKMAPHAYCHNCSSVLIRTWIPGEKVVGLHIRLEQDIITRLVLWT